MGAVRRTQHPVHLPGGAAVPLTFVPVVEMLHLHLAAEAYKYGYTVCSRKGGPSGEGKGCGENFSRTQKQSGTEQRSTEEKFGQPIKHPGGVRRWRTVSK